MSACGRCVDYPVCSTEAGGIRCGGHDYGYTDRFRDGARSDRGAAICICDCDGVRTIFQSGCGEGCLRRRRIVPQIRVGRRTTRCIHRDGAAGRAVAAHILDIDDIGYQQGRFLNSHAGGRRTAAICVRDRHRVSSGGKAGSRRRRLCGRVIPQVGIGAASARNRNRSGAIAFAITVHIHVYRYCSIQRTRCKSDR